MSSQACIGSEFCVFLLSQFQDEKRTEQYNHSCKRSVDQYGNTDLSNQSAMMSQCNNTKPRNWQLIRKSLQALTPQVTEFLKSVVYNGFFEKIEKLSQSVDVNAKLEADLMRVALGEAPLAGASDRVLSVLKVKKDIAYLNQF